MKDEYGWRRFVLDGMRGFIDYSTVVPSGGWRSGFRASRRAKGLAAIEKSTMATAPGVTVTGTSFLSVKKIRIST
ncbi:hypothetical protein Hanom_Chr09g00804531 [Helianthus anomalus]